MRKRFFSFILFLFLVYSFLSFADTQEQGQITKTAFSRVKNNYLSGLKKAGLKPENLEVYSIGQSHIDAAWRWRWTQTRDFKCPRTFSKAIRHIEMFPSFNYHQSAPQFYEWTKEVAPELFQKIVEAEKKGRWILVGGMWVEPDCNLPEGEAFARHQLYGQRFYLEHFGKISEISWLLDSFGYNWNLPQFALKAGQKYMWTSKLTWNEHTIFPFHLFHWQAPDGSKVLTHICPIVPIPTWFPFQELKPFARDDYNLSPGGDLGGFPLARNFKQTRYLLDPGESLSANYLTTPEEIKAKLSADFMPVVGVFYGLGDGGHGPVKKEIETQLALQELGYGKIGTANELFSAFEQYQDRLPVWNDEMYLEYHQGVMTTQEWIKRANRKAESLLRSAEALASAAFLLGKEYPMEKLTKLWKITLLNQFHDILPGSSIPEVYEDAKEHHQEIQSQTSQIIQNSLEYLAQKIDTDSKQDGLEPILVFNPLGWERSDVVKLSVSEQNSYQVFDAQGKEMPAQFAKSPEGELYLYFKPDSVPSLGWKVFYLKAGENCALAGPLVRESQDKIELENDLIRVGIDKKTGLVNSLFDKRLNREFIQAPSNKILAFKDIPKVYSAWNISSDYLNHPVEVPKPTKIRIEERGPVMVRVLVERDGYPTDFKQWITLYTGSPLVELITWTDMHWKETLVKVEFNTTIETEKVSADIPYAVIERSTHPKTNWDKARTEMPVQKWTDLSDGSAGIALINFGKYGFSLAPDGKGWRMSIVKSARYPKPTPGAKRVNNLWTYLPTPHTDQGEHWAHLALLPHQGTWREAKVYKAGYEYNTPMIAFIESAHNGELSPIASIITIDSPSAYIGSVKKAEDSDALIIRVVEGEGRDTNALIKLHPKFKIKQAFETDLIELDPKPLKVSGNALSFPVGHFEIKTLKIKLEGK